MRGKKVKRIKRGVLYAGASSTITTPDGCVVSRGWRAQYKIAKMVARGKDVAGGLLFQVNM